MYYRRCNPKTWNGYFFEVFIFPEVYWSTTRFIDNQYKMTIAFPSFEAHWGVIDFRILPLENNDILLGVMTSRMRFERTSKSGFPLSGPSDLKAGESVGHALYAIYPDFMDIAKDASLDYET